MSLTEFLRVCRNLLSQCQDGRGGGLEGGGFGAVSKQLGVGGNGLLPIITHQHHMSAVKSSSNFPNSQFSVQPRGAADVQATAVNEIYFLLD